MAKQVILNDTDISSEFFNSFNWFNFNYGDTVWLEDYRELGIESALFVTESEDTIYLRSKEWSYANNQQEEGDRK